MPHLTLLGKIYALMESSSQDTNCRHSNVPACPTTSIRWHLTLALSTSNVNAPDPSLSDSNPPTPIATRGWQASVRRNLASSHKTHMSRLTLPTTAPFEQKEFPRLSLPCKTDLNTRRAHDFGEKKTPSGQTVILKRQHFITFWANEFEKKYIMPPC